MPVLPCPITPLPVPTHIRVVNSSPRGAPRDAPRRRGIKVRLRQGNTLTFDKCPRRPVSPGLPGRRRHPAPLPRPCRPPFRSWPSLCISFLAAGVTISGAGAYDNVGGGPAPAVGAGTEAGSLVRRPRHRQQPRTPRTAPHRPLLQVTPAPTSRCLGGSARPGVAPRRPASDRTFGLFLSARPPCVAEAARAEGRCAHHCLGKQTGKGAQCPRCPTDRPVNHNQKALYKTSQQ